MRFVRATVPARPARGLRARVGGAGVAAALLWASGTTANAGAPQRIASFNLCADQLVVALADRSQIAGLSPYAADPNLSVVAREAATLPRAAWQVESVIPLRPDLVILGFRDRAVTRRMLDALGVPTVELDLVSDIESARRQVREVADLLGHPERGAALVAAIDAARARLATAARSRDATALWVERGGYAAGPRSLAAALLAEAGLRTPAGAPRGLGGFVSLEELLVLRPDYLVTSTVMREPADQGALFLTHPALRALYPPERHIVLPARYTLCAGPALVAALDYLADVVSGRAEDRPSLPDNTGSKTPE